jgi:hypothetical protein
MVNGEVKFLYSDYLFGKLYLYSGLKSINKAGTVIFLIFPPTLTSALIRVP